MRDIHLTLYFLPYEFKVSHNGILDETEVCGFISDLYDENWHILSNLYSTIAIYRQMNQTYKPVYQHSFQMTPTTVTHHNYGCDRVPIIFLYWSVVEGNRIATFIPQHDCLPAQFNPRVQYSRKFLSVQTVAYRFTFQPQVLFRLYLQRY